MMFLLAVLSVACVSLEVRSFSLARVPFLRSSSMRMSDSYTVMPAVADPKESLMKNVDSYSRTQLNEYVLALEKINPTSDPAKAALLNGVWEIVASGFGSPGIIGFTAIKAIPGSVVDITGAYFRQRCSPMKFCF